MKYVVMYKNKLNYNINTIENVTKKSVTKVNNISKCLREISPSTHEISPNSTHMAHCLKIS